VCDLFDAGTAAGVIDGEAAAGGVLATYGTFDGHEGGVDPAALLADGA